MTDQEIFEGGFRPGDIVEYTLGSMDNPCTVVTSQRFKERAGYDLPYKNVPFVDKHDHLWRTETKEDLKLISSRYAGHSIPEGTNVTFLGLEGVVTHKGAPTISDPETYYPVKIQDHFILVPESLLKVVVETEEPNPFGLIEL